MDQTTGDARNKESIVDLELDGMLKLLVLHMEHFIQAFRLSNCSWETIENETESCEQTTEPMRHHDGTYPF